MMNSIERTARRALMEMLGQRDSNGWKCAYCGCDLLPFGINELPTSATLDHRLPLARGGDNEADNLALACHRCNSIKGQLTDAEFIRAGVVTR